MKLFLMNMTKKFSYSQKYLLYLQIQHFSSYINTQHICIYIYLCMKKMYTYIFCFIVYPSINEKRFDIFYRREK